MTRGEPARLPVGDEPRAAEDTADVLKRLQESALGLLAGLERAPRSLRIKADQVEIAVEWPEPAAAAGPAGAPAAAPPAGWPAHGSWPAHGWPGPAPWPGPATAAPPGAAAAASGTAGTAAASGTAGIAAGNGAAAEEPHAFVTAQMVGVFYRSREPGARPFVETGDLVSTGQQVGIIEAMKLMIPVEADASGRVVEVLVEDGTAVEYGDRLFALAPAGG